MLSSLLGIHFYTWPWKQFSCSAAMQIELRLSFPGLLYTRFFTAVEAVDLLDKKEEGKAQEKQRNDHCLG